MLLSINRDMLNHTQISLIESALYSRELVANLYIFLAVLCIRGMTESLAPSQINGNFLIHSKGPMRKSGASSLEKQAK